VRWRGHNLLNLALLVGIALLVLGIASIWWGGGSVTSGIPSAKGPEVPLAPILRDQEPLSSFAVVSARNLFSPDRKGPALGQANNQNSLDGCQLLGTIVIGHTRAALIGGKTGTPGKNGPEVEVVYLGQEWGGYKLMEVLNDSVILQGKEGRRTLNFPE
jgi:hypothetical protein